MGAMKDESDHMAIPASEVSEASDDAASETCARDEESANPDFAAKLTARYERLSLLTLDLAEEAGEAAVNWSMVDNDPKRPGRFERRIAAMTKAIWAHQAIERLRTKHARVSDGILEEAERPIMPSGAAPTAPVVESTRPKSSARANGKPQAIGPQTRQISVARTAPTIQPARPELPATFSCKAQATDSKAAYSAKNPYNNAQVAGLRSAPSPALFPRFIALPFRSAEERHNLAADARHCWRRTQRGFP